MEEKKVFTYFVYFSFQCNDGKWTEINAVNDLPFKIDSLENLNKIHERFVAELNTKLILDGVRVINLIIKNFILINET